MKKKKKSISRSENMSRIRGKDTSIEVRLRKALWVRGIRYQKTCKDVYGKPDICFKGKKIAVFCDSEFWHGKYFLEGRYIPKTNTKFWVDKIKKNMERDHQVNEELTVKGWNILRFWGEQIDKELDKCVQKIIDALGC